MNRRSMYTGNDTARIPLALQSIFLNGSRGAVINTPPPGKIAMKRFYRWNRRNGDGSSRRSIVTDVAMGAGTNNCEPNDKKVRKKRVSTTSTGSTILTKF